MNHFIPRLSLTVLGAILISLSLHAQTPAPIRQLALTHSGAYDFFVHQGQSAGDSVYPYVASMAQAGGRTYQLDGQFLSLGSGGSGWLSGQIPPLLLDSFSSAWDPASFTPLQVPQVQGATLAARNYTSFMISPRNFIQYWIDPTNGNLLLNSAGQPGGINPEGDLQGFQNLVSEYVTTLNRVTAAIPHATIHIYEFLPPTEGFLPHTDDPSQNNTITASHLQAYTNHALTRHQVWLDRFVADVRAHPNLRAGTTIETIPINRIICRLLQQHPSLLVGRDYFDVARDGAPHFGDVAGTSHLFEAFIAPVLYSTLFREPVPSTYQVRTGNLFASDFPNIVSFVAQELGVSSSSPNPSTPQWRRWEDTVTGWTIQHGTHFDPTQEGLPAPDNRSVISLYSNQSTAEITFQGSGVRLAALTFPQSVQVDIDLNGAAISTANGVSSTAATSTQVWDSGPLPEGTYTLRVRSRGDWFALDYLEVLSTQQPPGGVTPPPPPPTPTVIRPAVSGPYTFQVRQDGSGISTTIQAAVDAALPGDTIEVHAGLYPESVHITTANLHLLARGDVRLEGNESYGIRIDGDDTVLQGFTVRDIMTERFPSDHISTGIVISARRVEVLDCTAHSNGTNGFLVLSDAEDILIEAGAAYNNTIAGLAVDGSRGTTVRNLRLYNSGTDRGPDGSYQTYGVLADNWGDTIEVNGQITDVDGSNPIRDLTLNNLAIYGHPRYGIRLSVQNAALSTFPSGRITTSNLNITDCHIYENGSRLDSFVGGLYHLGGVLIQHVDGGSFSRNLVENNYTWGIDAYRCHRMIFEDNYFLTNNQGDSTTGVTIHSVGMEINGGVDNIIRRNLVTGSNAGIFTSVIPDSGDDALFGPTSARVENNILYGNVETDLEVLANPTIGTSTRTFTGNVIGLIPLNHLQYIISDIQANFQSQNQVGTNPGFQNVATRDYGLSATSPIRNQNRGPASLPVYRSLTEASGYDLFAQAEMDPLTPASSRAKDFDLDRDGRVNFFEYATGGNVSMVDEVTMSVSPSSRTTETAMSLTLRGNDPDLSFHIAYAAELTAFNSPVSLRYQNGRWTSGSPAVEIRSATFLGEGVWRLDLHLPITGNQIFTRLDVTDVRT